VIISSKPIKGSRGVSACAIKIFVKIAMAMIYQNQIPTRILKLKLPNV